MGKTLLLERSRRCFVIMVFVSSVASVYADALNAGAAVVDITPPLGHAMWGNGVRHVAPAVGVIDPLKARAVVLSVGREKIAVVSLDLGRAPTRKSSTIIEEALQKKVKLQKLFLVASHTHHGPVIELDHWLSPKKSYVRRLEKELIDVILKALFLGYCND